MPSKISATMQLSFLLILCLFKTGWCFINLCQNFTDGDTAVRIPCSRLAIPTNPKTHYVNGLKLELVPNNDLQINILNMSFTDIDWKYVIIKLFDQTEDSTEYCLTSVNFNKQNSFYYDCLGILQSDVKTHFMLAYEIKTATQLISKRLYFRVTMFNRLPDITTMPIFMYVEITDSKTYTLKAQRLDEHYNVSRYKVEIWKQNAFRLEFRELRIMNGSGEQQFDVHFNNRHHPGAHFFLVSVISSDCPEDMCYKTSSPIVCPSCRGTDILWVLYLAIMLSGLYMWFRYKAKYFRFRRGKEKQIWIIYQISTDKHNEVVAYFAKFLRQLTKRRVCIEAIPTFIDPDEELYMIPLGELPRGERPNHVIYIPPPRHEQTREIRFEARWKGRKTYIVTFEYCNTMLPVVLRNYPNFKLMDDFNRFARRFVWRFRRSDLLNYWIELNLKLKSAKNDTDDRLIRVSPPAIIFDGAQQEEQIGLAT